MGQFAEWLIVEIDRRGWDKAELARRAHVADVTIGRILNGTRQIGPDVAVAIARALGEPPELVMRRAGLLPAVPAEIEEREEVLGILARLSPGAKRVVLAMLRGLAGRAPRADDDPWKRAIVEELEAMPPDQRELALANLREYRRLVEQPAVRIIGEEPEREDTPQPDGERTAAR